MEHRNFPPSSCGMVLGAIGPRLDVCSNLGDIRASRIARQQESVRNDIDSLSEKVIGISFREYCGRAAAKPELNWRTRKKRIVFDRSTYDVRRTGKRVSIRREVYSCSARSPLAQNIETGDNSITGIPSPPGQASWRYSLQTCRYWRS